MGQEPTGNKKIWRFSAVPWTLALAPPSLPSLNINQQTSAGNDVEDREPSHTVGGTANKYSQYGK